MEQQKSVIINLLSGYFGSYELKKQKAVWRCFGVDYEAEKAKQEAIWQQFQEKRRKKGRGEGGRNKRATQHRRIKRFLKALAGIDTQAKREEAVRKLEELAEMAHKYATDGKLTPSQRLKWARIEAYIYQTINSILREYDQAEIKRRIEELKRMIEDELRKRAGKA